MLDPNSTILAALYRGDTAGAAQLADAATALTIWEAAALGNDDAAAGLLEANGSLVNAVAPDGHMPLGLAAFFGRASMVRLLLARGADTAAPSRNDMKVQPLHAAVAGRNGDCVEAILDAGADPNARQQVGYTPLMGAASAGREDLVDLLLDRGADPGAVNDDGKSAAVIAREHGHDALARRLESA